MSAGLELSIVTPTAVLLARTPVLAVRAEDASGGFGVLAGHADFMTVLPASVLRWRPDATTTRFCALRGGLLTVTGGRAVAVTCREGLLGDDLDRLEAEVARMREVETDLDRRTRVEQTRLHAQAVRQLIRFLRPGHPGFVEAPAGPATATAQRAGSGDA